MDGAAVITVWVTLIVVAAVLLMADTARSKTCSECPHCKSKIEQAKRDQAWAVHKTYHAYTTNVPGCEFCDVRGEKGGN
jgi:uncharacterized protein with PIN domain